jgi:bifunctional non-homologous end joining protein LigD
MERYPAGIGEKGFWQKDVSRGFPSWLRGVGLAEGSFVAVEIVPAFVVMRERASAPFAAA